MVAASIAASQNSSVNLVRRALDGDRFALTQLHRQYNGMVYAIAFSRTHDSGMADDITQEVFVLVMTRLDQLKTPEAFPGWLRTMAHRTSINFSIRRKKHLELLDCGLRVGDPRLMEPSEHLLLEEKRNATRSAVARLGDLDREAVELFYFKGLSLIEMSDQLHTPIGTVKRRLHVARKRLADKLARFAA